METRTGVVGNKLILSLHPCLHHQWNLHVLKISQQNKITVKEIYLVMASSFSQAQYLNTYQPNQILTNGSHQLYITQWFPHVLLKPIQN